MGIEIERKFLTRSDGWKARAVRSVAVRQGYLARGPEASVRVRVAGDQAWITIKGRSSGISRAEFEYLVPLEDAEQLLEFHCGGRHIAKTRYWVPCAEHTWEVDVFAGGNSGLVLAEIELQHADETFVLPDWAGAEVSDDPRYYNAYLAEHPYREWA